MALDVDGDGDISAKELMLLLKSLKRKLVITEAGINKMVKDTDLNGDGRIDIDEFLNMMECGEKREIILKALITRHGIRKAFEKYDRDKNGVITRDEFTRVVEDRFQSRLLPEQVDQILREADQNGDGVIDYEEFLKSFTYFPAKSSI